MEYLIDHKDYDEKVIVLHPNLGKGDIEVIGDVPIMIPKKPPRSKILFHNKKKREQRWSRLEFPEVVLKLGSQDAWDEQPKAFKDRYVPYIKEEFRRRKEGVWFYNNGVPTYITGGHYMLLQWGKVDGPTPQYLRYQRELEIHWLACVRDERCYGQNYAKCRRSGFTVLSASDMLDDATSVRDMLCGIQSKTGNDAQKNVFMKKVIPIFRGWPWFFKPIQDGTTNPRVELAFREPATKITRNNKVSTVDSGLNTVIDWRNTTNNAYDGDFLYRFFIDEAGKWIKPNDINEAWLIQRTCLERGVEIVGKARMGSTVNPMDQGGKEYKKIWYNSDPKKRNANGRTVSGLYKLFMPAYESLQGFFDVYGNPIVEDPEKPVLCIDGKTRTIGAKTHLMNERKSLEHDPAELNEKIRQFPFEEDEAFRDSIEGSMFNVGKIYEQINYNRELFPSPVIQGNFIWKEKDKEVIWSPDANGRFRICWLPPAHMTNQLSRNRQGKRVAPNGHIGVGGVDSYDIDATVDNRGSKGTLHLYKKFSMDGVSNMFILEYAARPPLAKIFYEDVLMAAFYYGFPLLIENNKYGIARHFEERGYDGYLMERPKFLEAKHARKTTRTKGIPSNSQDVITAHAHAIEAYIHHHVGRDVETDEMGSMYFDRTLEDWIGFKIDKRTKFDLSISSGLALLAAQNQAKVRDDSKLKGAKFLRRHKPIRRI